MEKKENYSMIITKIGEYQIDVPTIDVKDIIRYGLYIIIHKGKIRKVGLFGLGADSDSRKRFYGYRDNGINLKKYIDKPKRQNGSFKTIKVLNEKLKVGETVEVRFKELPDHKDMDGYRWKVDLSYEEKKLKARYKDSLWLA